MNGFFKLAIGFSLLFWLTNSVAETDIELNKVKYHHFDHSQAEVIVQYYTENPQAFSQFNDFEGFLRDLVSGRLMKMKLPQSTSEIISCYLAECGLAMRHYKNYIYRLLGVYNRLANAEKARQMLSNMVAIKTYNSANVPAHHNPEIIKFGRYIKQIAAEFNLGYRNIDNRIFEVTLDAGTEADGQSSADVFGILTHADVVPADINKWRLRNGRQLEPYQLTEIDGKYYGRGTEDDKASIVAALLAMRTITNSGIVLKRDIRLMIETTEETTGAGIEYYMQRETIPDYNIVLDSRYPAVIAEKGPGYIRSFFPLIEQNQGDQNVITDLRASMAGNQITKSAYVDIVTSNADLLKTQLIDTVDDFIFNTKLKQKGMFSILIDAKYPQLLRITVVGESAHGSRPEQGINPLPRLTAFIHHTNQILSLQANHYLHAVNYVNDIFSLKYLGNKLGIQVRNSFMGPLTVVPTQFTMHQGNLEVVANIRVPENDYTIEQTKNQIKQRLISYSKELNIPFQHTVEIGQWMVRNPNGAWIATLLDIFEQNTGVPGKPVATAGSTTAKQLPNAINFGPSLPGQKYMGHNANEFKFIKNFHLDIQMFTEMMARIGTQETL
ncbi:dipeptidase [Catenovulum sp. SM1970]|uniref:dipeptidase n=1 Tax=Marinifaba aquimaris TaxID=2741323 RepID=UPI001571A21E|nr:dipeptidase [Marinifaba aquimaris]NTS76744.1 dipeptidase [Marinifaba aquimaris]